MPWIQARRHLSIASLIVVSVVAAGCGFHLRGATAVPDGLSPIFVECAGVTPPALCEQVRELLALNKVNVLNEATPESYVMRVGDFNRSQRATAITASGGAAEYDLRLRSSLALFAPGGIPLLPPATVTANEVYRFDETNVLAQRREQQTLTEQLYQRLAQQMVYRLTPFTTEQVDILRTEYAADQQQADPAEASREAPAD